MTDLVQNMIEAAGGFTITEKLEAMKVVDEQLEMTMANLMDERAKFSAATGDDLERQAQAVVTLETYVAELLVVKKLLAPVG